MQWTAKPTQSGFYWYRDASGIGITVAAVDVTKTGNWYATVLGHWEDGVPLETLHGEWYGPISMPDE